jgi:predicted phosphodiesterase
MKIQGKIVCDYLDGEFGHLPTKTLAQKIYNENKEVFSGVDAVRSRIRYYRGQMGEMGRKTLTNKKFIMNKAEAASKANIGNPFHLPESEAEEWPPYILPTGKKYLVLSDIHIPYHDVPALTAAFKKGQEENIDAVLLNGDTCDFYGLSRWEKDPRKRKFSQELEDTKKFLRSLKEAFDVPIYFKVGNHEERLESYLRIKAPELLDVNEFQLDILLNFGELGIELITDKRIIKAGNLNIAHGHEFGRSVFSPVNPARGYYMKSKTSTMCGHNHQTSEHTEPDLNGKITTVWSTGCLCELHPMYMPVNKWNHGFAIVNVAKNGSFDVDNYRIIEGKIR